MHYDIPAVAPGNFYYAGCRNARSDPLQMLTASTDALTIAENLPAVVASRSIWEILAEQRFMRRVYGVSHKA